MERSTNPMDWIKDLVRSEEQMEESGIIDITGQNAAAKLLTQESVNFLERLKNEFVQAADIFNQLKASALGRLKVYGIAKTQADFMLFRNGFKMIFTLVEPGKVSIRFNFIGPQSAPSPVPTTNTQATALMEEHVIEAQWGPFGELIWTFQGHPVNTAALVKYHTTLFIKESAT